MESLPTVEPCQPVILSYGCCRSESYVSFDANELLVTLIVHHERSNKFLLLLLQEKSDFCLGIVCRGSRACVAVVLGAGRGFLPWIQGKERESCEREREIEIERESLKRGREKERGWSGLLTAKGGGGREWGVRAWGAARGERREGSGERERERES